MKLVAIDTNAYVAFKRGDLQVTEVLRNAEIVVASTVVLGELLAGFEAGTREEFNRKELAVFLGSPRVRVAAVTRVTAEFYARVYADLRRRGRPIPSNDLWIAAGALELGAPLLTLDRHFSEIDDLRSGSDVKQLTQ